MKNKLFKYFQNFWVIAIISSILPVSGMAQTPTPSTGGVRFYVDDAGFNSLKANRKTYEEIYVTLTMNQLSFVKKENQYLAVLQILGEITDISGGFVDSLRSTIPVVLDSLSGKFQKNSLFHNFGIYLTPGNYWLELTLEDYNSHRKGRKKIPLSVPDFAKPGLNISEMQLAARIISDTTKSQFYKNGIQVIPNPLRLYGTHLPMLYSYAEIYNLSPAKNRKTYRVSYAILDSNHSVFEKLTDQVLKKPGRTVLEARAINVVGLPTGIFYLQLTVKDLDSESKAVRLKSFRVENLSQEIARREKQAAPSKPTKLSQVNLNKAIEQIQYILTRSEKKILKKLDRAGKIRFLVNFWRLKDPNPETKVNEFQQEFYKRFNYANQHFGRYKLEGWQTDRGRILILYGPPDEIERHQYELDYKPYEIWHYYKLGGRLCVFSDLDGMGIYTLIHSTFDGEFHDREWKDRIYFMPTK
ncbi:hypothetical protein BMS3Bbin03_00401 [bacterium BMS3Bbin03]|nr:hypothetical protein BMS3Bbin03_00401 [bacterium BMS3Bbin03]